MSRYILLIIFLTLILGAALVSAQDIELTEAQLFESGAGFSFPDDWTVEENEGTYITVEGDLTSVTMVDYAHFVGVAATGRSKSLNWYFNQAADVDFVAADVEEVEVGGREALRYAYEDGDGNGALMLLISFSDDSFGLVDAVSLDGELEEEDVVLAIAESFDIGSEETAGSTEGSTGEPCTVSASEARTVRVRVGPGENRTSYTFLPANQTFEVQGQATADDDSLWWKLDREAVAPDAAANEAWIAQDDVEAEGGCAAVVDVNAPPIIPIVSEPPPPPADTGSGEQPPADQGSTTAGGTTPQPGTWTVNYRNPAPASCIGQGISQQTIYVDIPIEPEVLSLSLSGNSFILGGRRHTRLESGRHRGVWNVDVEGDTISSDSVLTVVSSSQMVGELRFTLVDGDISCSITVSLTVTRG